MERSIYFRFTNICDLGCDHCFYDQKEKRTMSEKEIVTALKNIEHAETLYVSGGEPFTQRRKLFKLLDAAQELLPSAYVVVQTNGAWITTTDNAVEGCRELHKRGVTRLEWMGDDKYHAAKGLDIDWLRSAEGPLFEAQRILYKEDGIIFPIGIDGCRGKPIGIGKAKRLPKQEQATSSRCCAFDNGKKVLFLAISPEGDVYPCPTQVTPPIGSIFSETLDEMLERALTTPLFEKLRTEGPAGVAHDRGIIDAADVGLFRKNSCVACDYLFHHPTRKRGKETTKIDYFGGA